MTTPPRFPRPQSGAGAAFYWIDKLKLDYFRQKKAKGAELGAEMAAYLKLQEDQQKNGS